MKSLAMGYRRWARIIFLLLQLITFSVEPTMEVTVDKSIIKTNQSEDGQTFSGVNSESQPSLEHSLLKNHTGQLLPNSFVDSSDGDKGSKLYISRVDMSRVESPSGTVPILRSYNGSTTTRSFGKIVGYNENGNRDGNQQIAAIGTKLSTFHGSQSSISVWEPDLGTGKPPRYSGAVVVVQNGIAPNISLATAGWAVDPDTYGDNHAHFEIEWRDNDKSCINLRCSGFVQTSKKIIPGAVLEPVSTIDGIQYFIELTIFKASHSEQWELKFGEELVGHWPAKLFTYMSEAANEVSWMGIVAAAPGEPYPPMGSGESTDEGERRAAFFRDVKLIDVSGNYAAPDLSSLYTREMAPDCFAVGRPDISDKGLHFYFGGGGCPPNQFIK